MWNHPLPADAIVPGEGAWRVTEMTESFVNLDVCLMELQARAPVTARAKIIRKRLPPFFTTTLLVSAPPLTYDRPRRPTWVSRIHPTC
jgi:hypothetical protein